MLLTIGYITAGYFEYIFFYWIYYYFGQIRRIEPGQTAIYTAILFLAWMVTQLPQKRSIFDAGRPVSAVFSSSVVGKREVVMN